MNPHRLDAEPADLPPAVVVGSASVVGLQTARLLADAGVQVIGLAGDARHFATRTRALHRVISADVHGPGLVDVLERLGPRLGRRAVLVPATDRAVLTVSEHRDRLDAWYHLPLAPHAVVESLLDKLRFAALARELGFDIPRTRIIDSDESARAATAELRMPVVVKPPVKSRAWQSVTRSKVCMAWSADEFAALLQRLRPVVPMLVAQEFVPGADDALYTCNTYFGVDRQPLVHFTSRKRRQWPPGLGIASYAVPVEAPEVAAIAVELFRKAGFHGLGYLEVKRDAITGDMRIIEANVGRPTGRASMAEACGVPLLMTMYADAAGLPLPAEHLRRQPSGGPPWVDIRRDALSAWHYWRRGELRAGTWLRELRASPTHAVWSARDPRPSALEMTQSIRKVTRRLSTAPRRSR